MLAPDTKTRKEENQQLEVFFERWVLQDIARQIFLDPRFCTDQELAKIQDGILPRIAHCLRTPVGSDVALLKSKEKQAAHYKNLQRCSSVWNCPLCAAKITEGRRNELIEGLNRWREMGEDHSQVMVTFTIPHNSKQSLSELRQGFMDARRWLKQQRPLKKNPELAVYKQIVKDFQIAGTVTALEVTFGDCGWHVHSHDLLLVRKVFDEVDIFQLERALTHAWIYACQRAKIEIPKVEDMLCNSVKVDLALTPADYVAKFGRDQRWGAQSELTKSHIKNGRQGGLTPWDFLRQIAENSGDERSYLKFGRLFREYAREFHGKRQLFYSKGLRKFLGLAKEKTDQELVESEEYPALLLGFLDKCHWQKVIKHKVRAKILKMACEMEFSKLIEFIQGLGDEKHETRSRSRSRSGIHQGQGGTLRELSGCG